MAAMRFLIAGRVQGVGFRAATCDVARRLDLRGHAANLDDGRVEVVAVGARAAIDTLATWLADGPTSARVTDVGRDEALFDPMPEDFEVR